MIKGICFDLDGVYFTRTGIKGFIRELATKSGNEIVPAEVMFSSIEISEFVRGKITEETFWNYVNSRLGLTLSVKVYADLLVSHYEIDPEIQKVVQKTKSLGYKTLVCSNNYLTRVNALQAKFNFFEDFDTRIFSYEVGTAKPDIMIFKKLIEQSQLKAEEIVYADDQADKLSGASILGINTAIYTTFEAYQQFLISLGVPL